MSYRVVKEPGAIFASALTTDYVEMTNNQDLDFLVATGVGTAADTTIKVKGKLGEDGTDKFIEFKMKTTGNFEDVTKDGKKLNIGGTAGECGFCAVRVDARVLGREGLDRVALTATAVSQSTVPGSVVAILSKARYSE